jgi:ERCC4-related helicase
MWIMPQFIAAKLYCLCQQQFNKDDFLIMIFDDCLHTVCRHAYIILVYLLVNTIVYWTYCTLNVHRMMI